MPLVVDANPLSPSFNSYASRVDANYYHEAVLHPDAWTDADVLVQMKALVSASRIIDANVNWIVTPEVLGYVPTEVRHATSELARRLIESGAPTPGSTDLLSTLKVLKAGPINLEFKEGASISTTPLPDDVFNIMRAYARRIVTAEDAATAGNSVGVSSIYRV